MYLVYCFKNDIALTSAIVGASTCKALVHDLPVNLQKWKKTFNEDTAT